jgi:hypothetical protein
LKKRFPRTSVIESMDQLGERKRCKSHCLGMLVIEIIEGKNKEGKSGDPDD